MSKASEYDDIDDFFCNDLSPSLSADDGFGTADIAVPTTLFMNKSKVRGSVSSFSKECSDGRDQANSEDEDGFRFRSRQRGRKERNSPGYGSISRSNSRSRRSRSRSLSSDSLSPVRPAKRSRNVEHSQEESDTNKFLAEIEQEAERASSLHNNGSLKNGSSNNKEIGTNIYNVGFISKLEGSTNKRINVRITGKKKFSAFLPIALKTFVKEYKIAASLHDKYQIDNVKIYREGVEIFKFMTCDSFNIAEAYASSSIDIEVYIVPNELASEFEIQWKQKIETKMKRVSISASPVDLDSDGIEFGNDDFRVNEYEKDLANARSLDETEIQYSNQISKPDDGNELIKVVLLGSDNKKVYVNVKPTTTFEKLAEHYRRIKKLPPTTKLILSFDHDDIDPSNTIFSAAIEDDDIVEVSVL
ncbi:Esc2p Ecym_5524 [Eremothecium cymbalariae DBVPG|uniref:Rad60/SUMO-like domain-containing protein n=1 Tax=Eremothecium cymbalariae (strain CBS 270.75 / DBVPG 7215 / KCTC 17166 / NRRL Y-17582) TaxID=931890 RepID=I6NDX3_ERECY|nr:hypothetical protein Ecym_5524 [Eremothecium cymbalariae DBVPG\